MFILCQRRDYKYILQTFIEKAFEALSIGMELRQQIRRGHIYIS